MKWYNDMTEQEKRSLKKSKCCMCSRCDFNSHCSHSFYADF